MTQTKSTKKALFMSMLSLLLCVAMLIGSTFAWFTDSVTGGRNKITAGNLDVELWHNSASVKTDTEVNGDTKLFLDADGNSILWEPGVIAYENFTVKNVGSLALKYELNLSVYGNNATTAGDSLDKIIGVAFIEDGTFDGNREAAQALTYGTLANMTKSGEIMPEDPDDTFAVVLYWKPSDNDNLYNLKNGLTTDDGEPLWIDLGVNLQATQTPYESDSFNKNYDEGLEVPKPLNLSVSGNLTETTKDDSSDSQEYYHVGNSTLSIDIPSEDVDGKDIEKVFLVVETESVTEGAYNLDISLENQDHDPIAEAPGEKMYRVNVKIGAGKSDIKVIHDGTAMEAGGSWEKEGYTYDDNTGILTLYVAHFSPFTITWRIPSSIVGYFDFFKAVKAISKDQGTVQFEMYQADKITFSSWDIRENEIKKISPSITWNDGFDMTVDKDGTVRLFAVSNSETKAIYILTETANEKIYFPEDSSNYFFYEVMPVYNDDGSLSGARSPMTEECAPTVFTFDKNINTSRVTDMSHMFADQQNCQGINGLENFDTSNVTNMSHMFELFAESHLYDKKFTLDLSSFDTSNVTNMRAMFSGGSNGAQRCYLYEVITGEKFDTSKVTDMRDMFSFRPYLAKITVAKDWDTTAVTQSKDMFYLCNRLKGGSTTKYATGNPTDKTYAHIDGGNGNPGYFTQAD